MKKEKRKAITDLEECVLTLWNAAGEYRRREIICMNERVELYVRKYILVYTRLLLVCMKAGW